VPVAEQASQTIEAATQPAAIGKATRIVAAMLSASMGETTKFEVALPRVEAAEMTPWIVVSKLPVAAEVLNSWIQVVQSPAGELRICLPDLEVCCGRTRLAQEEQGL